MFVDLIVYKYNSVLYDYALLYITSCKKEGGWGYVMAQYTTCVHGSAIFLTNTHNWCTTHAGVVAY